MEIARVISSLLAAAILNMRGVSGKPGWFWLFLLEGILTFLIGLTVSRMSREAVLLRTQPAQIFQGQLLIYRIVFLTELLLPPLLPNTYKRPSLAPAMVQRTRRSYHDQCMYFR